MLKLWILIDWHSSAGKNKILKMIPTVLFLFAVIIVDDVVFGP